jgi:hypothetical protein
MSRHTFGFAVRAMIFFLLSQAASVAILLSALFSERYSLGARWVTRLTVRERRANQNGKHDGEASFHRCSPKPEFSL